MTFECQKCGDRVEHDSPISRCDQPMTDVTRIGARYRWRRGEDGEPIGTAHLVDGREVQLCSGPMRAVQA